MSGGVAGLGDAATLAARQAALGAPHMRDLRAFAAELRAVTGLPVPDADPADAGAAAEMLLLLETPGPAIFGTGIVSRDNPTPTGVNLRRFLDEAGIPRDRTLLWNAIPWVIHAAGARNRAPRAGEINAGIAWLPPLLALVPNLRVVVLAGRTAAAARPVLPRRLPNLCMPHPSPNSVCASPAVPAAIRAALAAAAQHLSGRVRAAA